MHVCYFLLIDELYHSANVLPEHVPDFAIIPNFITEKEESSLLKEIEKTWKRVKYEYSHWDNVSTHSSV